MGFPFEWGVVTDEIDQDLAKALRVARELGIGHVELNSVWGKNVIDLSPDEVDRARRLIEEAGVRVVAVDPPAFKACVVDALAPREVEGDEEFQRHLRMVSRGAER